MRTAIIIASAILWMLCLVPWLVLPLAGFWHAKLHAVFFSHGEG